MHELAVTESILEIVLDSARKNQASAVTDITLTIGSLSSIVDDCVQFYWDHISQGTICQNAKLHFKRVMASLKCLDCGKVYSLIEELTPCPSCGSINLNIITGEEFQVDHIEITTEETGKHETTS
ncbi:MAG: hydrogenase maturation nickel metallochaperone HypA [Anaerolineaceae bacterium]|jgi:hydrogenase nickel incorporation protein HypA/HybF|nr:hydrogenase maturation nickel metallochaperone HypA [Anaerolineaceae bacterium]